MGASEPRLASWSLLSLISVVAGLLADICRFALIADIPLPCHRAGSFDISDLVRRPVVANCCHVLSGYHRRGRLVVHGGALLLAAHHYSELVRRCTAASACRGFLTLQLPLGLVRELLGASSHTARAHRRERILTALKYCEEFLIVLALRVGRWWSLDLPVLKMLVVNVHQVLHVVLIEQPLGDAALPHVGRLLDVRLRTSLLGVV